jgi:hypothetical protein
MSVAGESELRVLKKDPWQLSVQVSGQGGGVQVALSATRAAGTP